MFNRFAFFLSFLASIFQGVYADDDEPVLPVRPAVINRSTNQTNVIQRDRPNQINIIRTNGYSGYYGNHSYYRSYFRDPYFYEYGEPKEAD